ncbi:SGNH/GDSL hydrolase family protein [Glutamicibacter protophormiae]
MPTTPLGIPTPSDSTKISELAATQRAGFNKVDDLLQGGINDVLETAGLVSTTDERLAQPTVGYEDINHAIVDPTGRMALGIRSTAEVVAPAGVETPLAGQPFRTPYGFAIADPSGHISELRVGTDGLLPDDVLQPVAQRMARFLPGSSGVRTAGVALTIPDSTTPSTTHNNVCGRLPVLLGARAGRWRVHIANTNDKSGTAYSGALSFTGVHLGKHQRNAAGELTGQFDGTPRQVAGAFTSPANGSEWVSAWIEDYPLVAQQDYVLSYGYTSAAQDNYLAYAGGWQSSSAGDVDAANPTLTQGKVMPLDVWLEVEVEAAVKIIAYGGDSLTGGIRSTLPVFDSWPARHAVANGAIHTMYSHGGTEFGDWLNANKRKWTKFSGLSKPDAMVIAWGNNDIFRGANLAEMQTNYRAMAALVRSLLTERIYAATVLPRLAPGAAAEPVRKNFNEWLLTTVPAGTQAVFDFATAIDDGTGATDPRWRSEPDNFHLTTAGYARCFQQINAPLA